MKFLSDFGRGLTPPTSFRLAAGADAAAAAKSAEKGRSRPFSATRVVLIVALVLASASTKAQIPVIGDLIGKVITAIDLKVQRIQTETIRLQEIQKAAENVMSELRLNDIANWVQQLKDLYANYFQELWKVKAVLSAYHKVYQIIQREKDLLAAYQRAMGLFRQDTHFSAAELTHMETVYSGLITESGKNLDRLEKVITGLVFQMTDQQRMEQIDIAADGMEKDYAAMQAFTNENALLSVQRARDENEINSLKKLYGL
jgi:hypothetical protein